MHQNGRQKEFNSSYILNIFGTLKTAQSTIWDTKTRNIHFVLREHTSNRKTRYRKIITTLDSVKMLEEKC